MKDQMDIYNASQRTYHVKDGRELAPGRTLSVDPDEAESLLKSYPGEIVSPDTYKSAGGKSRRDFALENQKIQGEIDQLKASLATGGNGGTDQTKDLTDKLTQAQATLLANADQITQLTANLEDAKKTLEQAQTDASTMVSAAQKETVDAQTELASLKEASTQALEAQQKTVADQISEYNSALDNLPEGAKAPHFVLTASQSGN